MSGLRLGCLRAILGRRKLDSCAARFRQADGDGLLCGSGAVLALLHVFDFFVDEFTGLCGWGLSLARVLFRSLQNFFFGHSNLLDFASNCGSMEEYG